MTCAYGIPGIISPHPSSKPCSTEWSERRVARQQGGVSAIQRKRVAPKGDQRNFEGDRSNSAGDRGSVSRSRDTTDALHDTAAIHTRKRRLISAATAIIPSPNVDPP